MTSSPARNQYAATLLTCSYLRGHDTHELTASPHDEGQLITRIRTKRRFLTPTKEKSWQSLRLGRPTQPTRETLVQRWGIYKYPPSLEGQVQPPSGGKLLLHSTEFIKWKIHWPNNLSNQQVRSHWFEHRRTLIEATLYLGLGIHFLNQYYITMHAQFVKG
jgi:hypothetical protein